MSSVRTIFRQDPNEAWRGALILSKDGDAKATLHNVVHVLENHPEWAGLFRYDEFGNRVIKTRKPPYDGEPGEFGDVDAIEVAAWFGRPDTLGVSIKSGMAAEAALAVASRNKFHPVQEWLDSLPEWDGTDRLAFLLSDFFGAENSDYTQAVGRNVFISAVARVMDPGCKVDTMLVLEGDQGLGKTKAIRELFNPWYADVTEPPGHKDFYQVLQGRWCCAIGEMHAFTKSDMSRVKQAITSQEDVYRPSYGRFARPFPRQCIFIGDTNDDTYLRDPTGARRFLPVKCGTGGVDVDALMKIREQVFSEALARWMGKEPWWVFPESAREEQDKRYMEDSWRDYVEPWLEGEGKPSSYDGFTSGRVMNVTITEVLDNALGLDINKHDQLAQKRVGAILRRMGWKREKIRRAERTTWGYKRPEGKK